MLIVRQVKGRTALVFVDNYSSTLKNLQSLFEEIKRDFDCLKPSEVRVVSLLGERYYRMTALLFEIPGDRIIPENYERVDNLVPIY